MASDSDKGDQKKTVFLLRDARTGDVVAREELFARYLPKVEELVSFYLGDRLKGHVDRDDIVQEALLRAVRSVHRFEQQPDSTFHAYLARIVRNTIIDESRRALSQKRGGGKVQREGDLTESHSGLSGMPANNPTASGVFRANELQGRYSEARAELTPRHREVIRLKDDLELSYADICKVMNIGNENAARGLYGRAKGSLRRVMGEEE